MTEEQNNQTEQRDRNALMVQKAAMVTDEQWPKERIRSLMFTVTPEGAKPEQVAALITFCTAYDLNPWLKEAWLAEMGGKLQIVTGRDAILKVCRSDPKYQGHSSGIVRTGDEFKKIQDGDTITVQHESNPFEDSATAKVIGSFCVVHYEGRPDVYVDLTENDMKSLLQKDTYRNHPVAMWLKQAVLTAHRLVSNISGMYEPQEFLDEEEQNAADAAHAADATRGGIDSLKERMAGTSGVETPDEPEEAEFEVVEGAEKPSDAAEEPNTEEVEHGPPEDDSGAGEAPEEAPDEEPEDAPVPEEEDGDAPETSKPVEESGADKKKKLLAGLHAAWGELFREFGFKVKANVRDDALHNYFNVKSLKQLEDRRLKTMRDGLNDKSKGGGCEQASKWLLDQQKLGTFDEEK